MVLKKHRGLALTLCLFLLFSFPSPGAVWAADDDWEDVDVYKGVLGYMIIDAEDAKVVLGSSDTIHFRLYDLNYDPYSGSLTGYITDPDDEKTYVSISGGQGNYTISNYSFDKLGDYSIFLWDSNDNSAGGAVEVIEPVLTTSGTLVANSESTVKVKFADPEGKALDRKLLTVDGTKVGVSSAAYTTLYDGTFSFTMTPKKLGTVDFVYGGHIVGSMEVVPAYSEGSRIGTEASNNLELSLAVSQSGWKRASSVILTRDDVVADAMVAVPLSKKYDAPILMTSSQTLDGRVLEEIINLGAKTVYIIGGTGAISTEIEAELQTFGLTTNRFEGSTRYDTAAQIAEQVGAADTVYLAYGYGEADAMAVSAFAAAQGAPILLTDTNSLPAETLNQLKQITPSEVVILGGTGIISTEVEGQLKAKYAVKRWGGADRYGTQQIILQNLLTQQAQVYISSSQVSPKDVTHGQPKADALVTAALAAKNGSFVVTVPQSSLPSAVIYSLLYNKGYISGATVVGNTEAVSVSLEKKIHELSEH
ncbi:MAG: cell wall-binding repeat-containing protein [Desulfitobacterium sp.]